MCHTAWRVQGHGTTAATRLLTSTIHAYDNVICGIAICSSLLRHAYSTSIIGDCETAGLVTGIGRSCIDNKGA